ncbi:hypothetical protein ABTX35_02965 [Streptomyces sp. NPDC096080]|uniref:hypothetical protein n=1 Tax=Streptomyces sp. NPDC096080 TaxID=3156693 RepID=UPI003321FA99
MAAHPDETKNPSRDPERRQFANLIRDRRAELGEGLDAFASRALDPVSGKRVTRGWIYRLETHESVTPPQVEELRALAEAARLPLGVLQDAAGQQFHGVDPLVGGSSAAKAFVHKLDQLPADQRARLLHFVDSLLPADPPDGEHR